MSGNQRMAILARCAAVLALSCAGRLDAAEPYAFPATARVGAADPARGPAPPPPPPVLTSTLPFAPTCIQDFPNANRALAIDAGGNLYSVASCSGDIQVVVSTSGGAAWSPPVTVVSGVVPSTAQAFVTIAGGTLPGHAIVAWSDGLSVGASATTDFGRTFSTPTQVLTGALVPQQGLDALAAGAAYHVMVHDIGLGGARMVRSLDRGGAWQPEVDVVIPWVFGDLLHDVATGNIELVSDNPSVYRSTSTDGGASFPPFAPMEGTCCVYYSDWAMGCGLIYTTGDSGGGTDLIWRYDVTSGATVEQLFTLGQGIPQLRSVAVDARGDAFTVAVTATGVELTRWRADDAAVEPPIVVAEGGLRPHLVTCGAGTAHVIWQDAAGLIQFATYCLGASCCEATGCAPRVITLLRNGDISSLYPLWPPPFEIIAPGDGSGAPGRTALDRLVPAERFAYFRPGPLADEMFRGGPLVYYELEGGGAARVLRLAKTATDVIFDF